MKKTKDITADPLWIDESTISIGSTLNLIGFYQENSDAELNTGESVKVPVLIATCVSNYKAETRSMASLVEGKINQGKEVTLIVVESH